MIDWVSRQARKAGFTIVIGRSNYTIAKPYVELHCSRGGSYDKRSERSGKKLKREGTGSRKSNCPFKINSYVFFPANKWMIIVTNGPHNHKIKPKLEGYLNAGRLTGSTKGIVTDLSKSLVGPKKILSHLKDKVEDNDTNIKQVYNCRHMLKASAKGDKTELQHLIAKLEEHRYVHFSRTKNETSTLQDIFFAHPDSIKLLNTFLLVLVMDSTYKTNMYKMPLFEIVGTTSTEKTYSVGFAFVANEKEENFTWVLQIVRGLLISKANEHKVILTDRCNGLMNAISNVFPDTKALLCYFHINKNVKQHYIFDCKVTAREGQEQEVKKKDLVDNIMRAWDKVVESDLKAQLNSYFEHIGSDKTAKHVFAQEPYISLADDEDWLWRYKFHSLPDDAAVVNMFESYVMDNKLHICVRSVCNCQNCR